jgi:hypothetical protein
MNLEEVPMMSFMSAISIRHLLVADGLISGVAGMAMIAAARLAEPLLNIPEPLLRTAGVVLLPFAAMVLAFSRQVTRSKVWTVVALNVAWVLASVVVVLGGIIEPTSLGLAVVLVQAAVVAALAELQFFRLRRVLAAA